MIRSSFSWGFEVELLGAFWGLLAGTRVLFVAPRPLQALTGFVLSFPFEDPVVARRLMYFTDQAPQMWEAYTKQGQLGWGRGRRVLNISACWSSWHVNPNPISYSKRIKPSLILNP